VIVIGIDPHMHTHTAVALDAATGRVVGELTVKARTSGFERLVEWARRLDDERLFAVEDGRHVSGSLERHLIGRGEESLRVPARLMGLSRRADRVRGKSDPIDAEAVARAALAHPDLPRATLAGPEREIGLLGAHRESMINERTAIQNRLRWLVHDIDPDLAPGPRTLDRLCQLDRLQAGLEEIEQCVGVRICLELVSRCREITRRANELEREIEALVRAPRTGTAADPRLWWAHRRQDRRGDRPGEPVPDRRPLRPLRRHSSRSCLLRSDPPPAVQPAGQPPAERGSSPDRRHTDPDP
jgi:transposase